MEKEEIMRNIRCPICHAELDFTSNQLICKKCNNAQIRFIGGSLAFSKKDHAWHQLNDNQYVELLKLANEKPWKEALYDVFLNHWGKFLADYNTSPLRYTFANYFIPKKDNQNILDIGCSFGNLSIHLAEKGHQVFAVDTPKEVIEWLNLLKKKLNLNNLNAISIDSLDYQGLPFKEGLFDVVILGMTLQWIGAFNKKKTAEKIQKEAIDEIYRVLKKQGILILYDVNKYSFQYFLGVNDASGVPYAGILPKHIRILWMILYKALVFPFKKLHRYRFAKEVGQHRSVHVNQRYTYKTAGKLLAKSGFKYQIKYIPIPSAIFQKAFVPLQNESEAEQRFQKWFQKNVQAMTKGHYIAKLFFWAMKLIKRQRFLSDGYFIVAEK